MFPLALASSVLPFGIVVELLFKILLYIFCICVKNTSCLNAFFIILQILQHGTTLLLVYPKEESIRSIPTKGFDPQ